MAPRQSLLDVPRKEVTALGVVPPPAILVQTPTFEGSLATLFFCVRDRKIDLLEIPLLPICEAYFTYLFDNRQADLDEAASALVALAYLLERKAWMLLPVPETDSCQDDPAELPEPTTHEFDVAIEALKVWHDERSRLFFRSADAGPDPYELPYQLANVSTTDLARAFERVLKRAKPDKPEVLAKPRRSLAEQMKIVLLAVCHEWRSLEALVTEDYTRTEAMYWFLALLELIRLGQVGVRVQNDEVMFRRA